MFDYYVGIDYSGKASPRQKHTSIQIFEADERGEPRRALGSRSWSRQGCYAYLAGLLREQREGRRGTMIAGMDHGFSFPLSYFRGELPHKPALYSWLDFLQHFDQHWGEAREKPVSAISSPMLPYPNPTELRLTEKFTSSAKSVLHLNPTLISVAFSTHAGLPWIYDLRREFSDVVHIWPYDGLSPPSQMSVIAEVYPSLLYNRYSYPGELAKRDERDAYAISMWLQEQDRTGGLHQYMRLATLTPQQISEVVPLEGWILGVL
ncbi:hypothetical protein [Paenibacillus nasutitermitis]|uniref:Uncharacterized protein n=1 Tax=Paenibacillus nasutitermitis TaxID=1652958 RepID=A0A916Z8R0_9BACL|nr:hypothetical protein [Paenibacillus nasutitermitis]GGD81320.1 hypothetical protein GCM10010911_44340 [Paenibacillus nasutitermitis]